VNNCVLVNAEPGITCDMLLSTMVKTLPLVTRDLSYPLSSALFLTERVGFKTAA
jgi:hypothetical protein